MTTEERINKIKKLLDSATPGPWFKNPTPIDEDGWGTSTAIASTGRGWMIYAQPQGGVAPGANHDLIAAAPTDLKWAVEEIERLRTENLRLREALDDIQYSISNPICLHRATGSDFDKTNTLESIADIVKQALKDQA